MCEASRRGFRSIYEALGVSPLLEEKGESAYGLDSRIPSNLSSVCVYVSYPFVRSYAGKLDDTVEELRKLGLAVRLLLPSSSSCASLIALNRWTTRTQLLCSCRIRCAFRGRLSACLLI
jgi:hypothetical protein